jgi:branched-chain amino acid transport system substrate-binding protein
MMGYRGVKYDQTGQNVLASTYLIQLKGKQYEPVWPEKSATTPIQWPVQSAQH